MALHYGRQMPLSPLAAPVAFAIIAAFGFSLSPLSPGRRAAAEAADDVISPRRISRAEIRSPAFTMPAATPD